MSLHFFADIQAADTAEQFPMKQLDEMDLTLYLQTEGRRVAAELRGKTTFGSRTEQGLSPASSVSPAPVSPFQIAPSGPSAQQQCAAPAADSQRPACSLSEALQRMGVRSTPLRRL
jgi:hypothetical protein